MRQYLGIYNEALASMRDINYLIAIDTRYIGEAAGQAKDDELVELVFRFMNSYLRATLNARDVRTAYNVLNQYRQLVEAMLRLGRNEAALAGVRHMNYYGHVSFDMKLTFVTETIAYDVSALCQYANELGSPVEDAMLQHFLELDRPLQGQQPGERLARRAQGPGQARRLLPDARRRGQSAAHQARHGARTRRAPEQHPTRPRGGHQQGLLGDHRSRPQLRVHAARPAQVPPPVFRLAQHRRRRALRTAAPARTRSELNRALMPTPDACSALRACARSPPKRRAGARRGRGRDRDRSGVALP